MSLRFIFGRAGSGKSHYCLSDMKKNLKENYDKPLILLVPEQFSFQAQKNLLDIVGEQGTLQAQVLDFKRMAYRVFNEVGGITKEHMNASGKAMVINHILNNNQDKFNAFNKACRQKGFIDTMGDTIGELKKYGITPEKLNEILPTLEEEKDLKRKVQDIHLIYSNYEEILHENYIDSNDDLTILAEKIQQWEFIKGAEIWIDEFTDFNAQQYFVIEKLLTLCKRVNITLCSGSDGKNVSEESNNIFSTTSKTENMLLKIISERNISLDQPVILNSMPYHRFKSSEDIGFLEHNFYSYPYEKYKIAPKDVSLFVSANTYSEVENVAMDIVRQCRDNGVRYGDIAVATRDLSLYDNIVSAVFTEYEIPYFIDKKKEIQNNLLVILTISAFQINIKNWSYEEVFRYLKTGLTEIALEDIDVLENYVLSNGIKGRTKWLQKEKWDWPSDYNNSEEEIDRINDIRNKVIAPLCKLHSDVKGVGSAARFSTAVVDFFENINISEKLSMIIEEFSNQKNQELVSEYNQIWNLIMDLLSQLVEVMANTEISTDEFVKLLSIGFSENKMGLIPPAMDQVLVGSVDRLKNHNVSVLYVVGANDGIFPKTMDEEGILNDSDRALLREKGVELARDTRTQAFQEQYLVYTTLTTASKYLRISYPIADFQGRPLRPSIIISRLKTIFPKIIEDSDVLEKSGCEEELKYISSKVPTFNHLITKLRSSVDGNNCDDIWKDVYKWYISEKQWEDKISNVFSGMDYTNQVEHIEEDKVRKVYGNNITMSTTRLEAYVRCPFAYFVQYGLNAKERNVHMLTPPDLGYFMHEVIDRYSISVTEKQMTWGNISDEWRTNEIDGIVEKLVEERNLAIFNYSARYRYLTKRLKRVLNRAMKVISNQVSLGNFIPIGYEVEFNHGKAYPPIIIEMPSGEKINIIGKIDRIDMVEKDGETYIRVIDYKSGNKIFKLSDVYYGLQIQLLLYLDAILINESNGMDKPSLPGGILYFKIDDPIVKEEEPLSEEEIETEIFKALKMKGLVLSDPEILKEMDNNIGINSYIIPAGIKSDGTLTSNSSAATEQQFGYLREHVRKNLTKCCMEMLAGNIDIMPYKRNKETACDYCEYSSICQFDTSIKQNNYKMVRDKKDDEIWNLLKIESGDGEVNERELD